MWVGGNLWLLRVCNIVFPSTVPFCFLYIWFSSLALEAVSVISQPTNQPTRRLVQLVEHRTAVREVAGSKPLPEQHSGSLNN